MPQKLRFLFIVGCLEPGHDGVGDYTKTLAQQLCQQGHSCLVVAIKDPFVVKNLAYSLNLRALSYATIRLRDASNQKSYFSEIIKGFQPHYISLQFVPYAFDKRGLPFYLAKLLKPLAKEYNFHIMMHEIWIGFDASSSLKHRLIGKLQRLCIQYLFKALQPQCVHTHTTIYKNHLQALYPGVSLLPLFSSIGNTGVESSLEAFQNLILEKGLSFKSYDRPLYWIFAFFGALHPEWPSEPLMQRIATAAKAEQKSVLILHFGHIGRGQSTWEALETHYSPAFKFFKLGPLVPQEIELILHHIDFGIATSPLHLLEKSASALTFLEWGCPLIVNRIERDVKLSTFFETRIFKINTENFTKRLAQAKRSPYSPRINEACMQFLKNLHVTPSHPFGYENTH
jgi:hypothetical protein